VLLERALKSIQGQNYHDYCVSLVNDGGAKFPIEDITEKSSLGDRLVVTHHESSQGMEAASNVGIQACKSRYVVVHDDDDSWEPDFLAKTVSILEGSGEDVKGIATDTTTIVEEIRGDKATTVSSFPSPTNGQEITLWSMLKNNLFQPISFVFERDVFNRIGFFDPNLPVLGDWEFNIRFLSCFDIHRLRESLANYHIRPSGAANIYSNTTTHHNDLHEIYRARIVNRYLRQDLEQGAFGLGTMMALGQDLRHIEEIKEITVSFNELKAHLAQKVRRVPGLGRVASPRSDG
jgi:glycosyltransferase involved in cell wall biosynthesis